jgi:hypothetical protein
VSRSARRSAGKSAPVFVQNLLEFGPPGVESRGAKTLKQEHVACPDSRCLSATVTVLFLSRPEN